MARKSKRTAENRARLIELRKLGLSLENCAKGVGASVSWLENWRKDDPELEEAMSQSSVCLVESQVRVLEGNTDTRVALAIARAKDASFNPDNTVTIDVKLDLPSLLTGAVQEVDWALVHARIMELPALQGGKDDTMVTVDPVGDESLEGSGED